MHHEDPEGFRGRIDDASRLTATGRLLRKFKEASMSSVAVEHRRGDMS